MVFVGNNNVILLFIFLESLICDKCSDEIGCMLDDINIELWVDIYKYMGLGEDLNSIFFVCLNFDVESGNLWILLLDVMR